MKRSRATDRARSRAGRAREEEHEVGDMREWWEKHAPRASKDLCVAPKKVAEVRDWLRSRVPSLRADHGNHGGGVVVGSGRVLLLTGPTGCGKSTTVELLCAELGLRLLRWSAPEMLRSC